MDQASEKQIFLFSTTSLFNSDLQDKILPHIFLRTVSNIVSSAII